MKSLVYILMLVILSVSAYAACPLVLSAQNTQDFLSSLSQFDADIKACPTALPSPLSTLYGNEKVTLKLDNENVVFTIVSGNMAAVAKGVGSGYTLSVSQCKFDKVLANQNRAGVLAQLYLAGDLDISASGFTKKLKLAATKPFIGIAAKKIATNIDLSCASANTAAPIMPIMYPQPKDCEETYLPGHKEYAANKEKWDSYSADSDGVCQSNKVVSCKYNVQLSINGYPYYLCWYDN